MSGSRLYRSQLSTGRKTRLLGATACRTADIDEAASFRIRLPDLNLATAAPASIGGLGAAPAVDSETATPNELLGLTEVDCLIGDVGDRPWAKS